MICVGIDLATEARNTAMARLRWRDGSALVEHVQVGVDDEEIVDAVRSADIAGIDCPLGWPEDFLDFLAAQRSGSMGAPDDSGIAWRRSLAYRRTDVVVHEVTGRWPLSVATDRIGLTAMRAVALLAALDAIGVNVDRSGRGRIAEVYPAAALRLWNLPAQGYKGSKGRVALGQLLAQFQAMAPWLALGKYAALMGRSDHAFDAVIAALIARAHSLELTAKPADVDRGHASVEGWIVLPTGRLSGLSPDQGGDQRE